MINDKRQIFLDPAVDLSEFRSIHLWRITHMKYMLLIYNEEKAWGKFSEAQRQGFMGEFMKFTQQIQSAGQWLASSQLQPTSAATSFRLRAGKRPLNHSPFSETPQQLGAYYLIQAQDLG